MQAVQCDERLVCIQHDLTRYLAASGIEFSDPLYFQLTQDNIRITLGDHTATAITLNAPMHLSELRAKLTRLSEQLKSDRRPLWGAWYIVPDKKQIAHPTHEPPIVLSQKEMQLLIMLLDKTPNSIHRDTLLRSIWGYGDTIDTNTLESHIYRLRQKLQPLDLGKHGIVTLSDGYAWVDPV